MEEDGTVKPARESKVGFNEVGKLRGPNNQSLSLTAAPIIREEKKKINL